MRMLLLLQGGNADQGSSADQGGSADQVGSAGQGGGSAGQVGRTQAGKEGCVGVDDSASTEASVDLTLCVIKMEEIYKTDTKTCEDGENC